MIETRIPGEIMEKARAHEVIDREMWKREGLDRGDLCVSLRLARWALREDIQRLAVKAVTSHGPWFWREVFGDNRSDCPSAIGGMCSAYDDELGVECGYLYIYEDYTYVCLRTKAAVACVPPEQRPLPEDCGDPKESEPSATADKGGAQ